MNWRGRSQKAGDRFVTAPLPAGFRVRLRPEVTISGDGRVLVGGSPRTLVELGPPALDALEPGDVLTVCDDATADFAARLLAGNLADPVPDPANAPSEADLTVVIPAYNSAQSLDRALTALAGGPEVVVVDDASADGGATAAVAERHGVRLIRREVNGGRGRHGIRAFWRCGRHSWPSSIRTSGLARPRCAGSWPTSPIPGWLWSRHGWWGWSTLQVRAGSNVSTACTAASTADPNPPRSPTLRP